MGEQYGLLPYLLGGGGLAAVLVAFFGMFKWQPREPKAPPQPPPQLGIQALLADHMAMERLVGEIRRLADAGEELAKVGGRLADMMDIAAAVERLTHNK